MMKLQLYLVSPASLLFTFSLRPPPFSILSFLTGHLVDIEKIAIIQIAV